MEKKNWQERLDALNSGCAADFQSCVTAIDEHAVSVIRELGACEMGAGCDAQEALGQMAMLLECAKLLRDSGLDLAEERTPAGLPGHLIDPRSTDAMDLVMGTLKRCGFNKATQRAVVLAIASELDEGDSQAPDGHIRIPDAQGKPAATPVPHSAAMSELDREDVVACAQNIWEASERALDLIGAGDRKPGLPDWKEVAAALVTVKHHTETLRLDVGAGEKVEQRNSGSNAPPDSNTSVPYGENLPHPEAAEKQHDAPPQGAKQANPAPPYKVLATEKDAVAFVVGMTNEVNRITYDEACRKSREDMRKFKENERLKRSLLTSGEAIVDEGLLESAIEALEDALERLPEVTEPSDGSDGLTELIVRAYSRVRVAWRCGTTRDDEESDIDVSDNESAEAGKVAENSLERREGVAS